jgi:hypothetical protein
MTERFIKFIPSEEALWLIQYKPNAFLLLTHIANTARRKLGHPDGLLIGQCHLEHWTKYGFTERKYRTAKQILVNRKHITIIETNRTRQKSTTGTTTKSTLVQICSSTVYDINPETNDDRNDDRETTDRRQTRMNKKEEEDHPSIPSFSEPGMIDDFSFEVEKTEVVAGIFMTPEELDSCMKIKGSLEKVKEAVAFIQNSPRRSQEITDWPNALSKWKTENKTKSRVNENIFYSENLCKEFPEFENGCGWKCSMHVDRKKDQRGIIFETRNAYQEDFFVSFSDGKFYDKCEEFIESKKMRKN